MRKLLLLGFLAVVLLLPASLSAQSDTPAPVCTPDDLAAALDAAEAAIAAIREAAPGDIDAALDLLRGLRGDLAAVAAVCQGFAFEGDQRQEVFGPITFSDGIYTATATTEGWLIVHLEPLAGDCDYFSFMLSEGDATNGAQDIFRPVGCTAMIEISNVTAPWSLTFSPVAVPQ